MPQITFTPLINIDEAYYPKPASQLLPTWYKETSSYIEGESKRIKHKNIFPYTIKKCMPVFDALTAGYILVNPVDYYISQNEGQTSYISPKNSLPLMQFHDIQQNPKYPNTMDPYPKFVNPFSIKTPKGYSCLFVPPLNQPNNIFEIFSGVVDTDTYTDAVNFPFVLLNKTYEGLIPAGTPIAQVIPFKREAWGHKIGNENDKKEAKRHQIKIDSHHFDSYKRFFRIKKEFK